MKKIIFATGNQDKMIEIRQILNGPDLQLVSLKEAGIQTEIMENGMTFEENAQIKANAIAKLAPNEVILADDSGLEIDYLNKEPGVFSARYLGEDTPYSEKNKQILYRLAGVERERRTARFVCAIAAALPDGTRLVTRGTVEGYIGWKPAGEHGFGYDPIFYVEELGCSTAEIPMEEKNAFSHRGNALRAMRKLLSEHGI